MQMRQEKISLWKNGIYTQNIEKKPEMIYPVNYGYVDGVLTGDGEEQEVV